MSKYDFIEESVENIDWVKKEYIKINKEYCQNDHHQRILSCMQNALLDKKRMLMLKTALEDEKLIELSGIPYQEVLKDYNETKDIYEDYMIEIENMKSQKGYLQTMFEKEDLLN